MIPAETVADGCPSTYPKKAVERTVFGQSSQNDNDNDNDDSWRVCVVDEQEESNAWCGNRRVGVGCAGDFDSCINPNLEGGGGQEDPSRNFHKERFRNPTKPWTMRNTPSPK
mmetsp:Transcript_21246/g.29569  ORF Transcript_21246/g.29569 Transcript_21246/m.29569 type:complete len:112 (-) Transcript_21246:231-566(-)